MIVIQKFCHTFSVKKQRGSYLNTAYHLFMIRHFVSFFPVRRKYIFLVCISIMTISLVLVEIILNCFQYISIKNFMFDTFLSVKKWSLRGDLLLLVIKKLCFAKKTSSKVLLSPGNWLHNSFYEILAEYLFFSFYYLERFQ